MTAANPAQAPQDTTLDVTVTGTGFTTGARAVWALNGDTTLVHVKSTKRVSDTQLVASLIIPANAPTASYDIQVYLVGGKKGVGAELFTVTLPDPTTTFWFPLADAALGPSERPSLYQRRLLGVRERSLRRGLGDARKPRDQR